MMKPDQRAQSRQGGCPSGGSAVTSYASNQYRALQQFFKWLTIEDEIPDPMARLKPPRVPDKPVPVPPGMNSGG